MNFITDRTQADVLLGTDKGKYGVDDLNRVESAVQELFALAKAVDVPYVPDVKTDWALPGVFSAGTWPTQGQMARYLENVHRLCRDLEIKANLPVTMEKLNWEGANAIEQALLRAYERIQTITQAFRFSGELFAGEENCV